MPSRCSARDVIVLRVKQLQCIVEDLLDEGVVLVTVQDNGRGISPTALPFIFDLFMQEESEQRAGLGIGLHLEFDEEAMLDLANDIRSLSDFKAQFRRSARTARKDRARSRPDHQWQS